MSRRANPTLIGLFVLGALTLVVGGLLIFGSGGLFRATTTYVMYFDESVTGLLPGAPVMFRGVKVGEVTQIKATIDEALDIDIPVVVFLRNDSVEQRTGVEQETLPDPRQVIPLLVKRGLRAEVALQSIVTGVLLVELDFHPETKAVFRGDGTIPEIPTVPSPLTQLQARVQELPIDEIAGQVLTVLRSIDGVLNSSELESAIANLNSALVAARELATRLDGQVEPLAASLEETLAATRSLAERLDAEVEPLARRLEETLDTVSEDSPTRYALDEALQELAAAARSVRLLAEYLERHPEALVSGKPGP